jgi:phosphoesterase RecJ-like protein
MVSGWERCLLLSHERPDGDALGSLIALKRMLAACGVEVVAAVFDEIPGRYAFLTDGEGLSDWREISSGAVFDGVILLDTCSFGQLTPAAEWLRAFDGPVIAVDHHVTRDEIATDLLVDEAASATCVILHEWASVNGWSPDRKAREALFVGLATDTGWFRHSNTDAATLSVAADLVANGVDASGIYQRLYMADSVGRVRLSAATMSGMALHCGERLAILTVTTEMFRETGAQAWETDELVNEPLRILGVDVSVLLAEGEGKGDPVKCSFRAKGEVDVAEIANGFGGGGHRKAAGARVVGSLEDVVRRVVEAVESRLGGDAG